MGQPKNPQIFIPIKPQRLSEEVYRREIAEAGGGNAAVKKNKLGTFTSYKLQVVSQTAKAGAKAFLTLQPGICNLRKLSLTSNRYFL